MMTDFTKIDTIIEKTGDTKRDLIPILQKIQEKYNYPPEDALHRISEITEITPAEVMSVASFYPQFRMKPAGKHFIQVCVGTACHVQGADAITDAFRKHLEIEDGSDTDKEGLFTVEEVACLGCCMLAPAIRIDDLIYGYLEPAKVKEVITDFLREESESAVSESSERGDKGVVGEVRLCLCSSCLAGGSGKVEQKLKEVIIKFNLAVEIKHVSCTGISFETPLIDVVLHNGTTFRYGTVHIDAVTGILMRHFNPSSIKSQLHSKIFLLIEKLLVNESHATPPTRYLRDIRADENEYCNCQKRVVTEHSGKHTPLNIDEYISSGGFEAWNTIRLKSTNETINELKKSGLRGRGGGGYPAWMKWENVKNAAPGHHKIVICNGDEGDPGAFMDRMILESFPFRVIEGIMIAATTVGATEGVFYIRSEYPLALNTIREAIRICEERGYLTAEVGSQRADGRGRKSEGRGQMAEVRCQVSGVRSQKVEVGEQMSEVRCQEKTVISNRLSVTGDQPTEEYRTPNSNAQLKSRNHQITQSPNFSLDIIEGAGAFVCGEETALISALEGRRGNPSSRPPYPAEKGFKNCPTLINNVETFATVPWILRNGSAKFAELGTLGSSGTKAFALAGKIRHGGLIEVPMGMTLQQIVFDVGGGIPDNKKVKAVQIGGPSGGCVPAALFDTPIDYEELVETGAIMGSGGLVVLDEDDCMVDIARYFISFVQRESCGKCTFCRIGTRRMLEILDALCEGKGKKGDIEQLIELSEQIKKGSLCGLGKTAPNPILSSIKYFRDEFDAHIEGECPAGKCTNLIRYFITTKCIGCTICAQNCPVDAIKSVPHKRHEIDSDKCIKCGVCQQGCPIEAIKK